MSKVLVNESSLTAIGDAIRAKNGTQNTYRPSEMAAAIDDISVAGGDDALKALIERTLTKIEIPKGIARIGPGAYMGCTEAIGAVTVPESVKRIEMNGFSDCSCISELKLPRGLEYIGGSAFLNMYSLESLILPPLITTLSSTMAMNSGFREFVAQGAIVSIAGAVFSNCTKCTSYDFTACTSVPTLANINAFNNINPDADIFVPAELYDEWIVATNWAQYADYIVGVGESGSLDYRLNPDAASYAVSGIGTYINTEGNGTNLVIPSEYNGLPVTAIEGDAFGGAEDIVSVSIPETVTSIGAAAFQDCVNITDIYFGANIGDLEYNAGIFTRAGHNGDGIKVVIGNKVTKVPKHLFSGGMPMFGYSPKITSVEFEGGSICTEIGDQAFYYCEPITFVAPPTLTSIGSYAFYTNGGTVLDFSACTQIPTLAASSLTGVLTIYVPAALYDEWIVATNWSANASIIVAK